MERQVYTTGQIARICRVSPKTVKKWFDNGDIEGYRIPHSGDRRVTHEALLRFMKAHSFPTDLIDIDRTRVLVVDDEYRVLNLVSQTFEHAHELDLKTASSGYAALLLVGSWHPDLVIMDLKMPGLDGFEACRRIRALPQTRDVKILVISGYATPDIVERAMECGANDFLAKPFEPAELEQAASKLLGKPIAGPRERAGDREA